MADTMADLQAAPVKICVPLSAMHFPLVDDTCGHMAKVAGLEKYGCGRARIICEELFNYAVKKADVSDSVDIAKITFKAVAEGLELSFVSKYLLFSPSNNSLQEYSAEALLEDEDDLQLSMQLVKGCAQKISLVKNGTERILTFLVNRSEVETGRRPWARLVPSIHEGIVLTPIKRDGQRLHRLDFEAKNKSYLIRRLAHYVLTMVDGEQSFSSIMAKSMQLLPDSSQLELEDLFESLIANDILQLKRLPRSEAEVDIPAGECSVATNVIKAYTDNRTR
ncbi:MAG: hypothetical protein OCC45_13675 [Desulfotalea sp.]